MESVQREGDSKSTTPEAPRSRSSEASGRRGKAIARGPLSVPPSWSADAPRIQTASPLSAVASRNATPRPTVENPMVSTYSKGLMAMLAWPGAISAATRSPDHRKSTADNAGFRRAETRARDDATAHDGKAADPASAVAQTATNTAVRTADHVIVIRILQGQTVTLPVGSTIALGERTTMLVERGSISVEGAGACVANVPVTVNDGSTVTTLGRCRAAGAVIPSNTRLLAGSYGAFTLTQYRRARVEIELINGSATTGTGPHVGQVTIPALRTATATVGAGGVTITNTGGTITVTTRRYPRLGYCNGARSPGRVRS